MNKIIYKEGNLFEAPKHTTILHSCNLQGVWGAGIAKQIKEKYPNSYHYYTSICSNKFAEIGTADCFVENGQTIAWIYVSNDYGKNVDSVEKIIKNTKLALINFEYYNHREKIYYVNSPKVNSGLFKVPWEKTEILINEFLERNDNIVWTVWELNENIKK